MIIPVNGSFPWLRIHIAGEVYVKHIDASTPLLEILTSLV